MQVAGYRCGKSTALFRTDTGNGGRGGERERNREQGGREAEACAP